MQIGGFQKFSMIDYPDKLCAIIFTQGCNFKCPYCHNPELNHHQNTKELINENDIIDFLKTRIKKLDAVVISGGEPTLQPNLISFIKKIKEMGFLVKLDTNGSQPHIIKKLLEDNLLDYIAMDIKSPLEKYEYYTKNTISTKAIKQSIDLIKNSNIKYEFRTTITKEELNINDFIEIGKILNNAKLYYLQKFTPTKTLNKDFLNVPHPSDEELLQIKKAIKPYIRQIEIR